MKFRYIGTTGLLSLCPFVSLNVMQSDGSYLHIDNISVGDEIEVEDVLAIRYLELDGKYERCH